MEEKSKLAPGEAESKAIAEVMKYDGGRRFEQKPSVAAAVRTMNARKPTMKPVGIFKHPTTWEQEELDFIADCLKQHIPIYTIANMVHCERHTLSALIKSDPELTRLQESKHEDLLEEAEYQADRLMKQGNAAVVIHVLQTLGRNKGWGDGDEGDGDGDSTSRIVMGVIPDDVVAAAEEETRKRKEAIDPKLMALTEEAVKEEVDRRMGVIEAEGVSASPVERGGESVVDAAQREEIDSYMQPGNTAGNGGVEVIDDPWASGADSPFFQ